MKNTVNVEVETFFSTSRCTARNLLLSDVKQRCAWGTYDNPLLGFYNFSICSDMEIQSLFRNWSNMGRKWFACERISDRCLVGILSLRDIRRFARSARLGIVINPAMVGQGYGTELIRGLLRFFFGEMRYRNLLIDVACFNKRAVKCYVKCGFMHTGRFWRKYPGPDSVMSTREFKENSEYFVLRNNILYALYNNMKLAGNGWECQQTADSIGNAETII